MKIEKQEIRNKTVKTRLSATEFEQLEKTLQLINQSDIEISQAKFIRMSIKSFISQVQSEGLTIDLVPK